MNPDRIKYFEVRDVGTFIPVMAVRVDTHDRDDGHWLLRRAGYRDAVYYFVFHLQTNMSQSDPYAWGDPTMRRAHLAIAKQWDEFADGDVVDVEFLSGRSPTPKVSERVA